MLAAEQTKPKLTTLKSIFWIIGIVTAAINAWLNRFFLSSPDGVSYLDIADSYLRGDWHAAINAYWSPFYSWILSVAFFFIRPSAKWEFAVVKGVNLFSFLVAIACFEILLRETLLYYRSSADEEHRLPEKTITVAGYTIFLWSSLYWTGVQSDTPDLLTSAAVYAATALILRTRRVHGDAGSFVSMAIVLALGYFSKAVFFPLSFALMFVCFVSLFKRKSDRLKVLLTLVVFSLLIAPWVIDLSRVKGHLTFGESGKLNYAWFVNPGFPSPNHWQGENATGIPVHPERKIFEHPAAFEFGHPIAGTYPPWFDPSYWFTGLSAKFNLHNHLRVLRINLLFYYDHFLRFLILTILIFLLIGRSFRSFIKALYRNWLLWIPALAGLALYVSAKTHTSMRYIAPFAALLIFSVLVSFRFNDHHRKEMAAKMIDLGAILLLAATVFFSLTRKLPETVAPFQVAEAMQRAGIHNGESIAIIGDEDDFVYWARLARVKIVAQIPEQKEFEEHTPDEGKILDALKNTGVKTVVMLASHRNLSGGWRKIDGTGFVLHFLQ